MTKKLPTIVVSMPAYDTMQVPTCLSLLKLFDKFTAAKIKGTINTFKCPYVGYSRNILTAMFLSTDFEYQLFVDADVEFEPDVVGRMLLAEKDFICCPYRKKTQDNSIKYSVFFDNFQNIKIDEKGITQVRRGPAGLTLIHRRVYEQLMAKHPELRIKNPGGGIPESAHKFLYNFWEVNFNDGIWIGEDVKFCDLVERAGFKFHALVDGETTHHGTYGWKGKLNDTFKKADVKDN
tara:strand:+ start:4313 stop:5017 length:705 start_codon:yes stop_codon:yes gene_type:complete